MKKITFLRANPKALGGAEIYLSRLVNALKNEGIECEIKSLKMPKFLSSWIKALIFNAYAKITKKDSFYFSLERISSADIYRAGDGVHRVYMSEKKSRLNPLNAVYCYLEKRCFKNAKMIIANSNFVKNQIINTYKIPSQKIKVIYNGVKIPDNFDKNESKKAVCDENLPLILFVGSGFERKGVAEFLELILLIKAPFNAIIIGKDKKAKSYEVRANKLNLSSKVQFLGAKNGVSDYYKAADIFILPTRYEPFSNVVLEALSFKNVVFTTAQNGASEILGREFVMKNPSDKSILNTLEILLTNPEILRTQQEKSYQIATNFSIEKNAKESLELIKSVLR